MGNKSLLENATIVIPTYNRYPYLERLLKFYEQYKINISIIILDSTPYEPSSEELIRLISNDKILWKKFDPDISYWDRVAESEKYIDTDYVTLCADDDFIMPYAISECIEFLISNPDYSSAHGLYFIHKRAEKANKLTFNMYPLYVQGRSAFEDSGRERVKAYLSGQTHYYPLYAVQRTENFNLIWSETKKYVSDWNLHEMFSCCVSFVYGKMKILPVFYASREPNTLAVNNYEIFKRTHSDIKVKYAVEGIAKHLRKMDGLTIEEAEKVVKDAFDSYLEIAKKSFKKRALANENVYVQYLQRIKHMLRVRTRLIALKNLLHYQGCHPSIFPKHLEDFIRVKESVLSSGLTAEELNESRRDFQ